MTSCRTALAAALCVCALSLSAQAANNYVVTTAPVAYSPLTGATTAVTPSNADDGFAVVNLGFSFPYYANTYTSVVVQANGAFFFSPTPSTSYCAVNFCRTGGKIPNSARAVHNFIAPWWSDHFIHSGGGIRYIKPNANEIVFEFYNYGYYSAPSQGLFNFQLRLNSSGLIQIHYGSHTSGTGRSDITLGFENDTGVEGQGFFACATGAGNCTPTTWPTNTLYTIGQPVKADLIVQDVTLANMLTTGADLTFTVSPTFRNYGQTAAPSFLWKAYLSSDQILDAADKLVYTATSPVSVGATAVGSATGNAVASPKPAPGSYYVLVEADTTNAVDEFSETNNVGRTANPFTSGLDLSAVAVSGPAVVSPASPITANVRFTNLGSDAVAQVSYRLLLSTDKVLDGNDREVFTASTPVSGAETIDKMVTFQLPNGVNIGDYYWALEVDSTKAVPESNETNNVVFSSTVVRVDLPDLAITAVDFLDTTGASVRNGYLGQPAKFAVTVSNIGKVPAGEFKVGVLLSLDATANFTSDTFFHDEPTTGLAVGESRTLTFPIQLPLVDRFNAKLATADYFIFGVADSFFTVPEPPPDTNNVKLVAGPVRLKSPGADYTFGAFSVPSAAAVGELMPVYRVLRNVGNSEGTAAKYRFYASVNNIISSSDFLLKQQVSGGESATFGTVTLGKGETDAKTQYLVLPADMPPGAYYIGALVDEDRELAELDEANNAALAGPIPVGSPALKVLNTQLPDAILDQPYRFTLTAASAGTSPIWAVDAAQGALPDGLTLSQEGVLSGTPKTLGTATVTLRVRKGEQEASARLTLRVLPVTAELAVSTRTLPPVVKAPGVRYEAAFAAAGGVAPYRWRIRSGSLPGGLRLSDNGVLAGALEPQVGFVTVTVGVEVSDAVGSHAVADVSLRVVEPTALLISAAVMADGMVGTSYLSDLSAHLATTVTPVSDARWSVVAGALPPGMTLTTQAGRGLIAGTPLAPGVFPFTVQVEDDKGRTDVADLVVSIFNPRAKVVAVNPPNAIHPGSDVGFSFSYGSGTGGDVTFALFSGELPKGLTLSEKGLVSGKVAEDAPLRRYDFVVSAQDGQGAGGYGPFALEISELPKTKKGCGAADGGELMLPAAVALFAALLRRRKA